jgi:hypothetical protein
VEFRYEQVSIYVEVKFPLNTVGSGGGGSLLDVVLRRRHEFNYQLHLDYLNNYVMSWATVSWTDKFIISDAKPILIQGILENETLLE